MKKSILLDVIKNKKNRIPCVHITNINTGEEDLVTASSSDISPVLMDAVKEIFSTDKGQLIQLDGEEFFLDAHNPSLNLVIIGAVHITQSLVTMAKLHGFNCLIIDPREGFATQERFPETKIYNDWPDEIMPEITIDQRTAVVLLTHDPKIDDVALKIALNSACFYVGALGSRKTHAARLERLSKDIGTELLEKIHAPIGLNIGARNPVEIATSIMSEIISTLRNG
ncbi:XdhC family protein [Hyphomicrobiales bacterium]|jgi:xanthine dehydrogenase accessory factor|nr:XdhC family protein [Rhodobiaceae bacterium]MDC0139286.1 XdhC family protein [Hyphomicrobiales bacterium]MDC3272669.1 XdhC family protein [Hyphomicrobiales bacterium]